MAERVVREDNKGEGEGGVGGVYVHDESASDSWKSGEVERVCQSCCCCLVGERGGRIQEIDGPDRMRQWLW